VWNRRASDSVDSHLHASFHEQRTLPKPKTRQAGQPQDCPSQIKPCDSSPAWAVGSLGHTLSQKGSLPGKGPISEDLIFPKLAVTSGQPGASNLLLCYTFSSEGLSGRR
jgi:hypothetical protein